MAPAFAKPEQSALTIDVDTIVAAPAAHLPRNAVMWLSAFQRRVRAALFTALTRQVAELRLHPAVRFSVEDYAPVFLDLDLVILLAGEHTYGLRKVGGAADPPTLPAVISYCWASTVSAAGGFASAPAISAVTSGVG